MSSYPRERLTLHRARALTRLPICLPPSQKYLPSIVTGRRDPVILESYVCGNAVLYGSQSQFVVKIENTSGV